MWSTPSLSRNPGPTTIDLQRKGHQLAVRSPASRMRAPRSRGLGPGRWPGRCRWRLGWTGRCRERSGSPPSTAPPESPPRSPLTRISAGAGLPGGVYPGPTQETPPAGALWPASKTGLATSAHSQSSAAANRCSAAASRFRAGEAVIGSEWKSASHLLTRARSAGPARSARLEIPLAISHWRSRYMREATPTPEGHPPSRSRRRRSRPPPATRQRPQAGCDQSQIGGCALSHTRDKEVVRRGVRRHSDYLTTRGDGGPESLGARGAKAVAYARELEADHVDAEEISGQQDSDLRSKEAWISGQFHRPAQQRANVNTQWIAGSQGWRSGTFSPDQSQPRPTHVLSPEIAEPPPTATTDWVTANSPPEPTGQPV